MFAVLFTELLLTVTTLELLWWLELLEILELLELPELPELLLTAAVPPWLDEPPLELGVLVPTELLLAVALFALLELPELLATLELLELLALLVLVVLLELPGLFVPLLLLGGVAAGAEDEEDSIFCSKASEEDESSV